MFRLLSGAYTQPPCSFSRKTLKRTHRLAAGIVLRLADSLKEFPQSRDTFLSSKSVRNITAKQNGLEPVGRHLRIPKHGCRLASIGVCSPSPGGTITA